MKKRFPRSGVRRDGGGADAAAAGDARGESAVPATVRAGRPAAAGVAAAVGRAAGSDGASAGLPRRALCTSGAWARAPQFGPSVSAPSRRTRLSWRSSPARAGNSRGGLGVRSQLLRHLLRPRRRTHLDEQPARSRRPATARGEPAGTRSQSPAPRQQAMPGASAPSRSAPLPRGREERPESPG
jgi:hypothetical protein